MSCGLLFQVSPTCLAGLARTHPNLRRLRVVYQDLVELPVELHGLQHLEQVTHGEACNCILQWHT